ncbi:hypothetical protein BpHYR1_042464 [Brachionus plicatilis]|uniref:Uncharacterized protein n=1 Tax=Brachionus plicatilis TaxID=10195 RepID=A0A3M7S5Z8_BRAPC|nr:hypothetical protein BpHYR1_042464 [Brachionus plicatilis]
MLNSLNRNNGMPNCRSATLLFTDSDLTKFDFLLPLPDQLITLFTLFFSISPMCSSSSSELAESHVLRSSLEFLSSTLSSSNASLKKSASWSKSASILFGLSWATTRLASV